MNEGFLVLGWVVYFYLHSLLAATSVKAFFANRFSLTSPRTYRIGYNIIGLTGILLLFYFQFILPSTILFQPGLITICIALGLMLIGLIIMIVAIRNYDWKSFVGISEEKIYALVIAGMNKYVRHPLYSGTMLFVAGYFIWQPYFKNLLLMFLMWIYLAIGIFYEEKKLVNLYGNVYKNYQKRVKKMIPFIW
jgi:protein-S-isoprenylcysteine O-methyltransferase Ste14